MGNFKNPRSRKPGKRLGNLIRIARPAAEENCVKKCVRICMSEQFLARFIREVRRAAEKSTCKKY